PNMCRVAGVRGTWTVMKSDSRRRFSKSAWVLRLGGVRTRMLKPAAGWATAGARGAAPAEAGGLAGEAGPGDWGGGPPGQGAGGGEVVAFDDAACDGQQERPGEIGGGFGEDAGGVGDGDAAAGGFGDVDVVGADAEVGDDAELFAGGVEEGGGGPVVTHY